ncbi:hypothetical protein KC460_03920 [Candidatus Dependentiae bacterium]|nr:hypothetical protein [Candidatus Dependentiae bacterium]
MESKDKKMAENRLTFWKCFCIQLRRKWIGCIDILMAGGFLGCILKMPWQWAYILSGLISLFLSMLHEAYKRYNKLRQ